MNMAIKKSLAVVLSLALLVSCLILPTALGVSAEAVTVWDGTSYVTPTNVDEDGVYLIGTPAELAGFIKADGKIGGTPAKARLTADIFLNDMVVSVKDGVASAVKYSDSTQAIDLTDDSKNGLNEWFDTVTSNGFSGELDGDGHTVYGLYVRHNDSTNQNHRAGLIQVAGEGATVKNLAIKNSYMYTSGNWKCAFFVGECQAKKAIVTNCCVDESNYHEGYCAPAIVGGGDAGADVADCYTRATLKSTGRTDNGTIIGDSWAGKETVKRCYSTGRILRDQFAAHATDSYVFDKAPGKDTLAKAPNLGVAYTVTATYPELKIFAEDTGIWGGWQSTELEGEGTAEKPYKITNGEDLAYAIHNTSAGACYELTNDIYLNDITKINWQSGAVQDGYVARSWYQDTAVEGTFNGNGHVVYGLYYAGEVLQDWGVNGSVALFPRVKYKATLTVSKLGVDNAYISAPRNASAFVGSTTDSNANTTTYVNLSEAYSGKDVTLKSYLTGSAIAGMRQIEIRITDFYSLDNQTYKSNGGIAGDAWGGGAICERVYNATGPLSTKGVISANACYAVSAGKGCGNVNVISVEKMQGKLAATFMMLLGNKFVTTVTYPTLAAFIPDDEFDANVNMAVGGALFSGDGTEASPYLISDAEDLETMLGLAGNGAYYKLTADIYLNDVNAVNWKNGTVNAGYTPKEWFSGDRANGMGYKSYVKNNDVFSGSIDGNGYAIHGIYYANGNSHTTVGLIPYAKNLTIKNLGIEDSFIGGGRFIGGFVGYTQEGAKVTIEKCYIGDSCAVWGWNAGADYVTSDADIGSDRLCNGSSKTVYNEAENGKYRYDAETNTYVEIAEGEEYTGTRYEEDVVWSGVNFVSTAIGGIVARFESQTTANISDCISTADVSVHPVYAFGKENCGVTFDKPGQQGGGIGHIGGVWGDDWNATVTATNLFSVIAPHENAAATAFNLYTVADVRANDQTKVTVATGANGLDQMPALDKNVWYAVKADGKYPMLRVRGVVIADVNEDGVFETASDAAALRNVIISAISISNGDINRNGTVNICDLVAINNIK